MSNNRLLVLHVNRDERQRKTIDKILSQLKPDAQTDLLSLPGLDDARARIDDGLSYGLAIVEFNALCESGASVLDAFRARVPTAPIVLYGDPSPTAVRRALADEIEGVVAEPIVADRLLNELRFILAGNRYISPNAPGLAATPASPGAFPAAYDLPQPLLADLPVGISIAQSDRIVFANNYVLDRIGYSFAQLNQMSYLDTVCDPYKAQVRSVGERIKTGELKSIQYVAPIRTANGSQLWIEFDSQPTMIGGGPARLSVSRDITQRMKSISDARLATMSITDIPRHLEYHLREAEQPASLVPSTGRKSRRGQYGLTKRQFEILEQVGTGLSNRQIAAALGLSESTVKLHIHRVMRRLGVANRTAAALIVRNLEKPAIRSS